MALCCIIHNNRGMRNNFRAALAAALITSAATSCVRAQLKVTGSISAYGAAYRNYDQTLVIDQKDVTELGSVTAQADVSYLSISRATASTTVLSDIGRVGIEFAGSTKVVPVMNPKARTDAGTTADVRYNDSLSFYSPQIAEGEWMDLTLRARVSLGSVTGEVHGANRVDQTIAYGSSAFSFSLGNEDEQSPTWHQTTFNVTEQGVVQLPEGGFVIDLHFKAQNTPTQFHALELRAYTTTFARSYINGTAYSDLQTAYASESAQSIAWDGIVSAETLAEEIPIQGLVITSLSNIDYNLSYADLPPLSNVPEPATYGLTGAILLTCVLIRRLYYQKGNQ